MANRLITENSPYLLQHADNPVDWYPWGREALERAAAQDKPIFLSIGYAACHWCHVMAHESFENESTAAIMNQHFINIKVDREVRPDLDSIYMNAVVAMTGQGGWPMSIFLTPEGKPFYGGTYFPPVRRHNIPSFNEILLTIERLWREDRNQLLESGSKIAEHLRRNNELQSDIQPLSANTLDRAAMRLAQSYDWENGGWGQAPKFPQAMAIRFLLRRASRGDKLALDISNHALNAMARGGIFDVVGGGFARYSVDDLWLVPHFEKMLYDNALLARCYLISYMITGNEKFRIVCEKTLDFLMREMSDGILHKHPTSHGLFSSLDADSEGEEGKFYIWEWNEIQAILSQLREEPRLDTVDLNELFQKAFGITEGGNFEGRTILQQVIDNHQLAAIYKLSPEQVQGFLELILDRLLEVRNQRIRPAADDKVLVSWNALAIISFAEAARYLKRDDYLHFARQTASFLIEKLHPDDRLLRAYREGNARHNAYLEDIAAMIQALLALYQSDPDLHWYISATQLADEMLEHFKDPKGGFFDTRDDHEQLLLRPKEIQDNSTPSGNALAAMALLQLAGFTGNGEYSDMALHMFEPIQNYTMNYPGAFGEWLCGLDFALNEKKEVAIVGDPDNSMTHSLLQQLWSKYRPNVLAAISHPPIPSTAPMLLQNRSMLSNLPTAYVCEQFVCKYPVNSPDDLSAQLGD